MKLDSILWVSTNLLLKVESSHPLVPKRKLTASQMQRGKIYHKSDSTPQAVAAEMMRQTIHRDSDVSPQRLHHPSSVFDVDEDLKKSEIVSAIRIDPKLASMFDFEQNPAIPGKIATLN
jgi:hypothetical protein